jgi:hypothetical protein
MRIWRDNWLPRNIGLKITSERKSSRLIKVKSLIGSDQHWNEDLMKATFSPHDADQILSIKLPMELCKDVAAWNYEKSRIFSIRSAYKLAYNLAHECIVSQGNSYTGDANRSLWKCIWSAPVPTKIRIFGWRLAADNLPTKYNKWRHNLKMVNICSICGRESENSFHATVSCTKARALRHMMRNLWNLPKEKDFSFTGNDWLLILLSRDVLWYPQINNNDSFSFIQGSKTIHTSGKNRTSTIHTT